MLFTTEPHTTPNVFLIYTVFSSTSVSKPKRKDLYVCASSVDGRKSENWVL